MSSSEGTGREADPLRAGPGPGGPDWVALERSAAFRELSARRQRFVVPALAVAAVLYGSFIILAAWGRDFMGSSIHRGFTVAYAFGLALIVMVWAIAWSYARFSSERLTPLVDQLTGDAAQSVGGGRELPPGSDPRGPGRAEL